MKKWLVLSTFILLFGACNNEKAAGEGKEIESTSEAPKMFPADSLAFFHRFLREQNIQYNLRRYAEPEEFVLQENNKQPTSEGEWKPFADLLVLNVSGEKAIDLFSGNYIITERNGRKKFSAGEPDTELALIDLKANTRERILYVGPSYSIFEAAWLGDSSIIAAGGELLGAEKFQPVIWIIDLRKKMGKLYRYPDTLSANASDFLSKKYPSVNF